VLSVLSVAYPLAPVGPDSVGGAEQVLATLDRALVAAGHRSLVVACEGSVVAGELLAIPHARGVLDDAARHQAQAAVRRVLANADADLIHLHGIDFDAYLPPPGIPVLATLHLPPSWYGPAALDPARLGTWLHCVSAAQGRALMEQPHTRSVLPPIENGVDVEALGAVRHGKRGYALTLGRICPEKGQHIALQAAHRAGIGLVIGGKVFPYPAHQDYFASAVAPLLDRQRRFLGPLGFARKRRLLAGARCLLVPSSAPETSSLVAMEALACGTPVIAFPSGALAELVDEGRTGFLVRSVGEMADAIGHAGDIDPQTCRAVARERFSQQAMIAGYFAAYQKLLSA
jgi:glycosyltransferase involved in cell wall biosynthesis